MKKFRFIRIAGLIALLVSIPVMADDTEIFFGVPADDDPAPSKVMLSLDWRPNLTSPQCTFYSDPALSDCDELDALGPDIYAALVAYDELEMTEGQDVSLFDALRAVLKVVFDYIEPKGFEIGFMMSHDGNDPNCTADDGAFSNETGCSDGGYILRGFEVIDSSPEGQASKAELLSILANLPTPQGNASHSYQGRELFYEFYRYLIGGDVLNGHKGWSDYNSAAKPSNPSKNKSHYNLDQDYKNNGCDFETDRGCELADFTGKPRNRDADGNVISYWSSWDKGIETDAGDKYKSPYQDGDYTCSKTYTVNFLFNVSNQDADWNSEISKPIGNGNNEQGLELGNTTGANAFPEIIAKLYNHDHASNDVGVPVEGIQNVTSFFIVDQLNTKTTEYASAGGTGTPFPASENPQLLLENLISIFDSISSVSTSFTAASVPVNVQNRTESLPDMYLAIFKVDELGKPFWPGNVKKLTIKTELLENGTTSTSIDDALGEVAFNPITGRISDGARTFWTDHLADDVQTAEGDNEVAGYDGSSITRGGAGQKIPGYRETNDIATTISPTATNGAFASGESDGRQLFISPASVSGTRSDANPLVPLNADSIADGSLAADEEIQLLMGILIEDPNNLGQVPPVYITDTALVAAIDAQATNVDLSVEPDADARKKATQILLKWARGIDVFDWSGDGSFTDARPWIMGDPLHSRPLTINYGNIGLYDDPDIPDIRLLFGTNDGFFHSIRNADDDGVESGVEEWAFMPRELLANVKDLIGQGNVGMNKPYGVDLPPVSFLIDNDKDGNIERGDGGNTTFCNPGGTDPSDPADLDCDKAYVYVGLRRGGASYYALDVSAPEEEPRLLWQITNDGSADFAELGLSFSTPRLAWVQFEDVNGVNRFNDGTAVVNVPVPVLIFGGGLYGGWNDDGTRIGRDDVNYDVTAEVPPRDPVGAALFMVHARTGQLIWKAVYGAEGGVSANEYHHDGLINSITAAVTPVDSDGNGITDRIYVGDTGGVVWRFELPEYISSHDSTDTNYHNNFRRDYWRATKLAELGGAAGDTDDRRFYHGLSVVKYRDSIGAYDGIAIGSGDRTHPQSAPTGIDNRFFLIKDRLIYTDASPGDDAGVDGRDPYVLGDFRDITDACLNDNDNDKDANNQCIPATLINGWSLKLEETGEKNLSIPLISGGNINFTTYLPDGGEADGECAPNIGISRLYQVSIRDGSPDYHLSGKAEGTTLTKEDRYQNLASGIDGGVTAISPEVGLSGSKQTTLGDQRPNTFYWRELDIDVLDNTPSAP